MNFFRAIVQQIKRMPKGMRVVCMFLAFCSLFAPLSILPVGQKITEAPVSVPEFWREGAGPIFFGLGTLSAFTLVGFIGAYRWSRVLFLFFVGLFAVSSTFLQRSPQVEVVASALFLLALAAWYMFWRKTVQAYFREG